MTQRARLVTNWSAKTFEIDPDNGQIYGADDVLLSGEAPAITQISSAQLLAAKASPVVVLPSLGPGFIPQELLAVFIYRPVTVDYNVGDATLLFIGPAINPTQNNALQSLPVTILDGSKGPGNVIGKMPVVNLVFVAQSQLEDQALVLTHNGTAEITLGDGTATVFLYHYSVPLL